MSEFNIDKVVQSQYANSKRINDIINNFWDCINPENDIKNIYDKIINLNTAVGFGLDIWGRIVAISREFISIELKNKYLGFDPQGVHHTRIDTLDNAPFYQRIDGKVLLSDEGYRFYILIKALINISNSSLYNLNSMLNMLFGDNKNIMIIHTDTMALRLLILSDVPEVAKSALLRMNWLPAGVNLDIYQVITPTFGFNGSFLHPFNQGTFCSDVPRDL